MTCLPYNWPRKPPGSFGVTGADSHPEPTGKPVATWENTAKIIARILVEW